MAFLCVNGVYFLQKFQEKEKEGDFDSQIFGF
jgi:hypothetical protein